LDDGLLDGLQDFKASYEIFGCRQGKLFLCHVTKPWGLSLVWVANCAIQRFLSPEDGEVTVTLPVAIDSAWLPSTSWA
jgi:hypothetical protein